MSCRPGWNWNFKHILFTFSLVRDIKWNELHAAFYFNITEIGDQNPLVCYLFIAKEFQVPSSKSAPPIPNVDWEDFTAEFLRYYSPVFHVSCEFLLQLLV